MEEKFTPGPWKADPCVSMHDRPDLPCVVDADGLIVAQCWDDGHSEAECDANAALIAAAPDLYEALKKAAETFRVYERLHLAKGSPEGDAKALANQKTALMCEAALLRAVPKGSPQAASD